MSDARPEEIARQLEAHERRTDAIHAELGARITQVARDGVPMVVWQQAQQAQADVLARVEREHDAAVQRLAQEHGRDIAELKAQIREEFRELREEMTERAKSGAESRRHWRELFFIGVLPSLMTAVGILAAMWMNGSGKH